MLQNINFTRSVRGKFTLIRLLLPAFFLLCLLIPAANPAFAGTALSTDRLVQCDSSGAVTNNKAITGVNLPNIQYDATGHFYAKSVDVAIFTGSTLVKELDGYKTTNLQVAFGDVTNYDYDKTNPVVYQIKFRGHYGLVGECVEDIVEDWQSSGLYFTVMRPAVDIAVGGGHRCSVKTYKFHKYPIITH